ncbi:efflux transporter periplasmic adaptor subunit [Rhizobium tubonense]|uniref:Efflux transporter periplasmic adaptor subunit n=2 Tax=Rhizobium tubonense TaxID=484088 RepID=A0A2W4CUY8_9HYPH|nr:efflux transporter periplasmic adaptor subunit [Rhizobium tubonense]
MDPKENAPKNDGFNRLVYRVLFVAISTCLIGGGQVAAEEQAKPEGAAALTVAAIKSVTQDWPQTVPASGWLKPWHEAVIESETSGLRIIDVVADVGSIVKKGDTLVRLNQETVVADLRKEEAAVVAKEADLAKAKADADRAREIGGSGALSDQKRVEYLTTEQSAKAGLDSEKAALDSQRIKLEQTTITAVDDGIITSRSASLGAVVSTGTELFRLTRQQRIEWQAEVPTRYLAQIRQGQTTEIKGPDGTTFRGTVRLVAPTVNTETGRSIVYVTLPTEPQPHAGLYVSGTVDIGIKGALTVPESTLVFKDGINYIFTIDQANRVHRTRVDVGRRRDSRVEITSGLSGDEALVQTGGAFLSEGALVNVVRTAQ